MDEEVDWGVEEEDFDPWAVQSNSRNENGRAIGSGSGFEGNGAGLAAKEEEKGRIGAGEGEMGRYSWLSSRIKPPLKIFAGLADATSSL